MSISRLPLELEHKYTLSTSMSHHHEWVSGRFQNNGIFNLSESARYNFLLQKVKHRKELKEEHIEDAATELPTVERRR
ncbi:hypothetical protein LTR64_006031 [Lithohypha guttulata]|uniref:uncharacterized protein n=1 Tax=Lithohypha guttulata TaxID=1690604 RepID=UPI002DE0A2DE|nr:hypothetical protein LTR51_002171 [Lithohypha guttulata]